MTVTPADLALIDGFEKIRAYLLENDPSLETTAFARPRIPSDWARLSPQEYQEILLAVLLGVDRQTAAGRRAIHGHLKALREKMKASEAGHVSDGEGRSGRGELFRSNPRERWLREKAPVVARALKSLTPESENGKIPVVDDLGQSNGLRDAVARLRKRTRLLTSLRAYEFLQQIGYPIVVPDPPRQRLFQRLGWIQQTVSPARYPQEFFEMCSRLEHLTGEPLSAIHAATGLFAGSRDTRAAGTSPLAVCTARPRCGQCVLNGQCAYYRYRGEPQPAGSRAIKRMAVSEQPRTRFESLGPANLSEVELLALIVRTGAEGKSSLDLAREILERFGSLDALARAGLGELCQIKGIGRAKAIEIKAALELGRRLLGGPVVVGEAIHSSAEIFAAYRGLLAHEQQENFYLVVLNARNRIQSHFLISRGNLTGSQVHPREVMKVAIREAAASIIFVHNHPSGEPEPSEDDLEITERLMGAARLVGIRVLDHVIIGRDNYFSFADHNLLQAGGERS
jgi:DNA repair protein RadC